mgnify:CR=1 FL=1
MKGIVFAIISILVIAISIYIYDDQTETPSFLPLSTNISWDTLEKNEANQSQIDTIKTMLEDLKTFDQSIANLRQSVEIDVLDENLFLELESYRYDVNKDNVSFEMYQQQSITTDGYELFIDTGGITGELSTTIMNYETLDTAYFSTEIVLSNPPFSIEANEYQQMPIENATTQLTSLLGISIDLDPLTIIDTIDLSAPTTSYYALEHGYYIEAEALVIDGLLLGITNVPATISMVIYEGYLMTFNVSIESASLSVANTFIDNGEDTIDIVLSLQVSNDYDIWFDEVSVPSDDALEDYVVVDTFSFPDITSLFNS